MAGFRLDGAVVVITGGGRGIGLAIARELAAAGARVSLGDIDEVLAQQAAASLGGYGGFVDVRDRAAFEGFLVATENALGPIDVLINNAGIMPAGDFLEETDSASDTQIDINLRGVIFGCKAVMPKMLKRGRGHIVNVASMAGRIAVPGLAVYCATKYAVVGLTETLREEFRDSGIQFTTVMPSKVTTELASGTDEAGKGVPTASPEEVAVAVREAIEQRLQDVTVPRYLSSVSALQGISPRWLLRGLRRTLGDRRILEQVDHQARAGYTQRITSLEKVATVSAKPRATKKTTKTTVAKKSAPKKIAQVK